VPLSIYGRRPLTRLEAALYGGIAAILITFFAYRLLEVMELAERTAMEATVNKLNAAVNTRLAYEVMRGTVANAPAWAMRNPFELGNVSAGNFAGEVDSARPGALERGTWAFDASRAELIYLPRLGAGLQTSDPQGAVRFKAIVGRNGMGYMLVPTSPYRWE
jgi:hypothetical protein